MHSVLRASDFLLQLSNRMHSDEISVVRISRQLAMPPGTPLVSRHVTSRYEGEFESHFRSAFAARHSASFELVNEML